MELSPGAMITARLRLVKPVGSGGMGSVWVAYHEKLKSEVAVKFIEGAAKNNPLARARFEREAEIAAKLKNPHVAQMYDHGALADGTPFIVMELLDGQSLQERLRAGPLSLHETSLVISQAAQALGKAHKLGIVHRDVKPGNLFLIETDYELFVKLLDFGIAKSSVVPTDQELTKTGNLLGSPQYMSPEQFTEIKRVDQRADLWSLAVVAYRCLTTVPPFTGEALGNVIMAVMQRNYRPVSEIQTQLPTALDTWFARAFHEDLGQRFQSARELATSFVEVVRSAAPPGAPRPPLPSITAMTHAELAVGARPESKETAQLPDAWKAPSLSDSETTIELARNPTKPSVDAATFAPATTTMDTGLGNRRLGLLMAAGVLLVAAAIGGYSAFGGGGHTSAAPASGATGQFVVTPPATADTVAPEPSERIAETAPPAASAATTQASVRNGPQSIDVSAPVPLPAPSVPPARRARPVVSPTPRSKPAMPYVPSDTGF